MLHRSFKPAKCKTTLKLAASRMKVLKNKKEVQLKQMKRELAQLLESGRDQNALIQVEHVTREEKTMAAYDLLEIYCELIAARLPIIESQKNCPIDLKEAITSVMFASPRCADIPELMDVRKHFTAKYGKEFISAAVELRPDCGVSHMLVEKLSAKAPDGQTKIKILSAIAEEHNIKWDSKSFGEKELKPPDDLLNGPNTYEKASKMHTEPPIVQAHPSNAQAPPSHDREHNTLANFEQNIRSSTIPQNFASTDGSGGQTTMSATSHSGVRHSGTGSERMEVRYSHGDGDAFSLGKQNWNMEFKDATAAAQAAAESAERASMAARAAAELSSRGKITRKYSQESQKSNIHGLRDEGPRKNAASELPSEHFAKDSGYNSFHDRNPQTQTKQIDANEYDNQEELTERFYRDGHGSTNRSSQSAPLRSSTASIDDDKLMNDIQKEDRHSKKSSFEEEAIKTDKSACFSETSMNKQSIGSDVEFVSGQQVGLQSENNYFGEEGIRKQDSSVSSHSHSSNHGDDYDISHSSHRKFEIDAGEDPFFGVDQGNSHRINNAAVVFDESGSDDDDYRFDTRPGYDVPEFKLYSTLPGSESPAHLSVNTDAWRTRPSISESPDQYSSLSHVSAEWHSPPEVDESLTKSTHPSQSDDLLPANFDGSEGPSSDSEDELETSRLGEKTDTSILPHKQNICFRKPDHIQSGSPDHIQSGSHGLTGSSIIETGDSGSNRKQDLDYSSDDKELVEVSSENNHGMEFSAQSSRKIGFNGVLTNQSSKLTKSLLASDDMANKPFYNPVEEGKHQQSSQSSRLSLIHEVKATDNTCISESPDAVKDNGFFDQPNLESGKELNFGTLTGGLRNKGYRHPPYTRSPSSDVSSSSKKAAEDSVTAIEHSTPSPAVESSLNSGVSTKGKNKSSSGTPITHKDSDTDDSEEELPQQNSRSKEEPFNPNKRKEENNKLRLRASVTYFDSDDGDSEEDLPKRTVTSTGRAGSGFSRRTKATPSSGGISSFSKARVGSGASVNSDADAEKIPSRSFYGSDTPPKPWSQTVSSGHLGSYAEPSAASKPMPDSNTYMRSENLKSSPMEQPSNPLKMVASGSSESPKTSSVEAPSTENSLKKASHVHPKLPDYDSIAVKLQSLRLNRQ